MGEPAPDKNSAHYNGGRIHFSLSRDEGVLPFVSIMEEIEFVLNLQGEIPTVLCSLIENPVTVHKYNQGAIVLVVFPQMQPRTKSIAIKYHQFNFFCEW